MVTQPTRGRMGLEARQSGARVRDLNEDATLPVPAYSHGSVLFEVLFSINVLEFCSI